QCSNGVMGDTMSPRISILPLRLSNTRAAGSSGGTNLATGFPRLVITRGVRVFRTCSKSCKQCALNSPAGIVFIDAHLILIIDIECSGGALLTLVVVLESQVGDQLFAPEVA